MVPGSVLPSQPPVCSVELSFLYHSFSTALFSNSFLRTGNLCHAARTSDLFGHHEISVVVVSRGDYSIYCISQQSLTRFCRHLPKPILHWSLKKGQGLHNLWGSTVAKTVREKLNCLHADEQHRCRMDLFVLLQEDNLPANDKIMMR